MPPRNDSEIPTTAPKLLLTVKQASEALAISPRKLWSLRADANITSQYLE